MKKARQFFATRPIFTYEELAELLAVGEERSPRTADSLLAYHTRMGHLLRIRRRLCGRDRPPLHRGQSGARNVDHILTRTLLPEISRELLARRMSRWMMGGDFNTRSPWFHENHLHTDE